MECVIQKSNPYAKNAEVKGKSINTGKVIAGPRDSRNLVNPAKPVNMVVKKKAIVFKKR